jgi:pyridoxal phosphate enzyme (YggS family)
MQSHSTFPADHNYQISGLGAAGYAHALRDTRNRIQDACAMAGRSANDITLVAVSKMQPAEKIRELYSLGLRDFAESRYQELVRKAHDLADLRDLKWHFIGQVQRNKAGKIVGLVSMIQSVDRITLIPLLVKAAEERQKQVQVLIQLSIDGASTRGGASSADIFQLAAEIVTQPCLVLRGLMVVPPTSHGAADAYAQAASVARAIREQYQDATIFSAGMSGDLEEAIAHGSTLVRIGTALFGKRSSPTVD